jgi:hypothetical protein
MGMLRHTFRTITRPYYKAVAATIGDFVDDLVPAVVRAKGEPRAVDKQLKRFDTALDTFSRSSNAASLTAAVDYWAKRVTAPETRAATVQLFSDPAWLGRATIYLRQLHPEAGKGLAAFQRALNGAGLLPADRPSPRLAPHVSGPAEIARALFELAMMSVKSSEDLLRTTARICRKELDQMQMEAFFLTLTSGWMAISIETKDADLRASVCHQFDDLVRSFFGNQPHHVELFEQRQTSYALTLAPGAPISAMMGGEFARLCGSNDDVVKALGMSYVNAMFKAAEELAGAEATK